MKFSFDQVVNRRHTHSYKWDQSMKLYGNDNLLPLWVADMDFESPPAVKDALMKRAAQGIYGYTIKSEEYIDAIIDWYRRRHHWQLDREWLTDSPGIVTSLSLAVDLYSEPGSKVILQSPVYYPFYDVIRTNDRVVAKNPLVIRNGRYEMDYEHLESLMKDGAKLMLLCSPHNPGGRVWERRELERLGELCLQYGVTVISDEIHCDLVLPGTQHTPFASLSDAVADLTLTCLAPTKTFNMPGLHYSFIVAKNPAIKRKFDQQIKKLSLHMTNFFIPDVIRAVYEESDQWLDELLMYIKGNVDYAISYLAANLPEVKVMEPDGTYLLWVDCRGLNLDIPGLKKLMYEEAEVIFNEGSVFGTEAEGYLRINLACPRSILEEALQRFANAARARLGR